MRGETNGDGNEDATDERTRGRATKTKTRRLLTRGGRGAGLVVLVLVAVAAMALASTVYLTQTIPTTVAPGKPMTGCATVSYDASASGNDTTQAWVVYNCGTSPAFVTGAAGTYTPSVGTGGQADTYIVAASAAGAPSGTPTTGCAQFGSAVALASGSAVAGFTAGSTWDYCVDVAVGGTVSTFSVSWT